MILKALEMQGFKSFADKTVFEFEKGITAVVGPNGSGKSNISDAIRWVLGEQSTKSLRGSKMEDVIFSGTSVRRPLGYAQVTLTLDNTDRSIKKYDTDTVSVTRKYYRSGESEYAINGETVRLRDIHEMFMDTGLGRDGYSMVSQGKIDTMISTRGNERREMFEEAAGISHYRYSRTDSLKKLAQAEENLVRLRDILTELESRIGPLKAQSEKAEKFLVLAGEKKELEIGLWLHTIDKAKRELKEQEDKLAVCTNQYDQAENELETIERKIDEAISEGQRITVEIEEIRAGVAKYEEQALTIDANVAVLENSIEHNNGTIERITRERSENTSAQEAIEKEIENCRKEIEELTQLSQNKQKQLADLAERIAETQKQGGSLDDESSTLSGEIARLTKSLADNRVASSTAHSSIDEIRSRCGSIDKLIEERRQTAGELEKEEKRRENELSELEETLTSLKNTVSGYEIRVENRRRKAEEMKKSIDDKAFEIRKKESRAKMLEDLEKNMEGYSGAAKAVMREVRRGTLRGIYGAISQLITVDDRFAVAVETAFGAAIQNIVTDSENDAKRAIEFLKRSNSGRATFLPLTAIKAKTLQENGLDECLGFVDIATNLLSYDKKYDAVMKNLLGRTVVCEDMESAIAIGKRYSNRFKIVTLDGQVINAGGSMTGGSRTQNAGILSRGTEIERLVGEVREEQKKLDFMSGNYKLLTEELGSSTAELEGARSDLLRNQEDKIRRQGELRLTQEQLAAARKSLDELEKEKVSSGERIKAIQKICGEVDARIEKIGAEIEQREKKLGELGEMRQKSSELKEKISQEATEINLAIREAEKDIQIRQDSVRELQERIGSQSSKLLELDGEIEEIKNKNKELSDEIESLRAKAKSLRENGGLSKERIAKLQNDRNEAEALSTKLRVLERNKTAEREQISGELARLEERKVAMLKEYDDTINKLYDEYQLTRREAEQLGIAVGEPHKAQRRLNELKSQIRSLGSVNVGAIEEYKEVGERYEFMSSQVSDVEKSKAELIKLIDELTSKMAEQFREQFAKISAEFKTTFQELFSGGMAELRLEDPGNVLESNIEIKVQPPGKNVQNIDLLSGGEKALSAIALLIAIIKVNPAPFCIFDEVEAALDEVNVSKYAQYLRRMTDTTQFILITHRRGSMEEADTLYGVTMQEEGVSKLLELKTAEMARRLGIT
ncbi:MAG: chromosome segregation protein SMC [Oscillospiraceae bacterium]|nr:chromosome segregation protein SMC [Oscillospiraceae bacterium]